MEWSSRLCHVCLLFWTFYSSFKVSNGSAFFSVTSYPVKNPIFVQNDEIVTLSCQVQSHYDSCSWAHLAKSADERCRLTHTWEWDLRNAHYKHDPKTEKKCNSPKLDIPLDDNYRHCNLTIRGFTSDDAGKWKCAVRDWNLKRQDYHVFNLVLAAAEESFTKKTNKFYIESFQPNEYVFKEQGDWLTMSCSVNDHFDVCEWQHLGRVCRLEYKWEWDAANARYHDNPIEEKSCPHHRLNLPGDEEFRKCYLIIDNIKNEDNGEWKCVVKDFGLASEDAHTFDLTVLDKKEANVLDEGSYNHPRKLNFPPHHRYQQEKITELFDDIHNIIDDKAPKEIEFNKDEVKSGGFMETVHHVEEDLEDIWHDVSDPLLGKNDSSQEGSDTIFYVAVIGIPAVFLFLCVFAAVVYFPRHRSVPVSTKG